MAYLSLYRKWRPQGFDDVVGQEHVVRTLKNALDEGRIAHAYLFSGPRGTGKTTLARLLAKGVNCVEGPTSQPCNRCENCTALNSGYAMDVIEIDGASNRGIDEIRDLREKTRYAPAAGRYKVYIIDEVHMLTTEAFNALLKILEEPPAHVLFVFATTELHRIPATIISRCQTFDFRRFSSQEIYARLAYIAQQEGFEIAEEALRLISRRAEGGMRDALGILDQCVSFAGTRVDLDSVLQVLGTVSKDTLFRFVAVILGGDVATALGIVKEVLDGGHDARQFIIDVDRCLRDLTVAKVVGAQTDELMEMSSQEIGQLLERFPTVTVDRLLTIYDLFAEAEAEIKRSAEVRLPLERAVIRATHEASQPSMEDLLQRIEELEKQVASLCEARVAAVEVEKPATEKPSTVVPQEPAARKETPTPAAEARQGGKTEQQVLARLQTDWERIIRRCREDRRVDIEAFLKEAVPTDLANGVLVLSFSQDKRFHKASVEQQKNKEYVERFFSKVTGQRITVQCRFMEEGKTPKDPEEKALIDDPVLEAALKFFPGTVTKIDEPGD